MSGSRRYDATVSERRGRGGVKINENKSRGPLVRNKKRKKEKNRVKCFAREKEMTATKTENGRRREHVGSLAGFKRNLNF